MKKLLILLLITALSIAIYAGEKTNKTVVTSGQDKVADVQKAKNIYVYVTFDGCKLAGKTLDNWFADKKPGMKEKSITKFYSMFDKKAKSLGKKWNLKRVSSPAEAKDGYLIFFNYDEAIVITGIGGQGNATIKIAKSNSQDDVLITGNIYAFSLAKNPAYLDPKVQFSGLAERFVIELVQFFKGK